jgi:hypothetical protein
VTTPRRLASWLASPLAYPSVQIARQTRCRVLLGPFARTRYPFSFLARNLFLGPPQVGSYEGELHPVVERIVASEPEVLVNVGAAEGYYTVGFARRLPELEVVAFEAEPAIAAAASRLAELNGVAGRVEVRGACTTDELAELDSRLAGKRVCVLMDCEGCERELADPGLAPWLESASFVVELHTSVDAEIETLLEQRFGTTHETRVVRARPPWASQWPELMRLRGLRPIDRELLVAEFRHGGQDWLVATPR